ncbi:transcriptional regulator [Aneurinibacillus migulanus]|uniref:sigma-54 interaction domain-containing protein n=1 Tax=Aneurinibacillus migulanus TaxID=47500 RepID=UPI0005B90889|nr:sigma 54-interacting transcriptional regulator [Aneurinibacillus migulanus]KIV54609.1 transcriptional regulator [Aneurinibacillus migulanus]KPD07993.1 transcriptional regulator [Aneurinibacillus migulanus]MCP1358532.1 sigma 54-interacting transcriptional regulator [Aneurinibacillus migulanus]CEH30208.1 Transcriptional regulator containing PAS, AAA-typ e ATPase, and DNA-binding domains [Aneurinibacillus migulanus]
MASFIRIQEFIQTYAENIAEVLDLDVTVLDGNGIRIGGTGYYRDSIGKSAPEGSFFRMILETGKPGMIYDMKKNESQCMGCKFMNQCKELATIGFPILKKEQPIGVVGIIGFSPEQKEKMIINSDKLIRFLQHMSMLLENKLVVLDFGNNMDCKIQEDMPLSAKRVSFESIIGRDSGLQEVIKKARRIVNSPSTVLIRGKSGTGKELLAKAIHYESERRMHAFVAINCAAIPENLLESELFGYEGGAFTGSRREGSIGKFELANKGTIFLDEIGDMPLFLQSKLLRVLQEKEIERVGGKKAIPVNVRVIAATHQNLEEMVQQGSFREDLYYRLNVIPLYMKPLKERRDDISLYLNYFLRKHGRIMNRNFLRIDPMLERWLVQYDWPGNIRQLENAIEYMVNMAESETISFQDIPDYLLQQEDIPVNQKGLSLEQMVSEYEKNIIQSYFLSEKYRNDKEQIALELQISLSTLYRKLEKYKLC